MFCAVDQLTDAGGLSHAADAALQSVLTAAATQALGAVCDLKEVGGDTYVRLNDDRVRVRAGLCWHGVTHWAPASTRAAYKHTIISSQSHS